MCLPPELEHELTVIEFALPGKEALRAVLGGIMESAGIKSMENEAREKAQAVKKNGILEIIETKESLKSIGGLDVLKDWLLKRRHAFSQRAIEYGLPTPKGLLIIGIPGTGKSLTAKATANDVSQLPPEMLRKGRFDELFFVDLPNQQEREAIWGIQIGKYGRDSKDFDLVQLAKVTEGLTGSEIENAFVEALYLAFDAAKEPTDLDIAGVLTGFVPLSKLMAEQISGLKNWAKGRARLATSFEQERRGLRKIGV